MTIQPALPPLSLYIHIPWCVRKCPYCDFNSHAKSGELPEAAYIDAMLHDLDQDLDYARGRSIQTIFIGGGTPSLFSATAYEKLITGLQQRLDFAEEIEITLEANPGTLEQGRFAAYRQLGINRLSIGIQSFNERQLKNLGRIHSRNDALKAIESARTSGFDNFNIDLMHALSDQTLEDAIEDLTIALDAGAPHLSWYQLTIEPNTEFYKRPPSLPTDIEIVHMQEAGIALLSEAGFQRYEVSAFARPGHQARHNLNYWEFGDYLALGAGAHGKVTTEDGSRIRYQKTRKPDDYLRRRPSRTSKIESINQADLPFEFLMNALRLSAGFDTQLFCTRTGLPWDTIESQVTELVEQDLLAEHQGRYRTTARGFDMLDSVLARFLA